MTPQLQSKLNALARKYGWSEVEKLHFHELCVKLAKIQKEEMVKKIAA